LIRAEIAIISINIFIIIRLRRLSLLSFPLYIFIIIIINAIIFFSHYLHSSSFH